MALKELIPRRLYGLRGNSIEAQFTLFKADFFNNGVAVAVDLNGAVTTALTISGATTTAFLITGLHTTGISVGVTGTPITYTAFGEKAIAVYATCDDTDGSDNFEPVLFNTIMTGAAQVGGRVRCHMQTDVKLGGWANALKASVDLQTSGGCSGLLSAFCCELVAAGSANAATLAVLEIELVTVASATFDGRHSLIYSNISPSGTATTNFLTNGNLWNLQGLGSASSSAKIFHTTGSVSGTHGLRIVIGSTNYDIMLIASTYA